MRRIFVIFICVVLLFSCNKNNKVQDSKIDNEPVFDNASTDVSASDPYPISVFYFSWKCDKSREFETIFMDNEYMIDESTITITGQSFNFNFKRGYLGWSYPPYTEVEYTINMHNLTWEQIELPNSHDRSSYFSEYNTDFLTGYKITGTVDNTIGYEDNIIGLKKAEYVFLHKNNSSIMLWWNDDFGPRVYYKQEASP